MGAECRRPDDQKKFEQTNTKVHTSQFRNQKKVKGIIINSTREIVKLIITHNYHKTEDINEQVQYNANAGVGLAVGLGNVNAQIAGRMEGHHKVEKKKKPNKKVNLYNIAPYTACQLRFSESMLGYSSLSIEKTQKGLLNHEKKILTKQIQDVEDLRYIILSEKQRIYCHELSKQEYEFALQLKNKNFFDLRPECRHFSHKLNQISSIPDEGKGCYVCLYLKNKSNDNTSWYTCSQCGLICCRVCSQKLSKVELKEVELKRSQPNNYSIGSMAEIGNSPVQKSRNQNSAPINKRNKNIDLTLLDSRRVFLSGQKSKGKNEDELEKQMGESRLTIQSRLSKVSRISKISVIPAKKNKYFIPRNINQENTSGPVNPQNSN